MSFDGIKPMVEYIFAIMDDNEEDEDFLKMLRRLDSQTYGELQYNRAHFYDTINSEGTDFSLQWQLLEEVALQLQMEDRFEYVYLNKYELKVLKYHMVHNGQDPDIVLLKLMKSRHHALMKKTVMR